MSDWNVRWDWRDWSLSRRERTGVNHWLGMFSLKCGQCLRWSLGCRDHWFCGCCEPCRLSLERMHAQIDEMEP